MTGSTNSMEDGNGTSARIFFGLPDVYVDKGAHIAHFFRGNEERFGVLVPFLQAGLEAGDQCILVAEASASPEIKACLEESGMDVAATLASGQLLLSEGGSTAEEMSRMFDAIISQARNSGREIIRIGGDMTWALGKLPTTEKLLEWEAFYDQYVGHRAGFVALCQYDHSRFDGSAIMCAFQTHPLSIIGNVVQENPFYRDPEEVLLELSRGAAPPTS